jgi:hypothetical protein
LYTRESYFRAVAGFSSGLELPSRRLPWRLAVSARTGVFVSASRSTDVAVFVPQTGDPRVVRNAPQRNRHVALERPKLPVASPSLLGENKIMHSPDPLRVLLDHLHALPWVYPTCKFEISERALCCHI